MPTEIDPGKRGNKHPILRASSWLLAILLAVGTLAIWPLTNWADPWNGSAAQAAGSPAASNANANAMKAPDYWQISTFNAANLSALPNNKALWGGQTALQQPAWTSPPGYGNNWDSNVEWRRVVPDPLLSTSVQLTFDFNYDLEPGYDFFRVEYNSGGSWIALGTFSGNNKDTGGAFQTVHFDESWTMSPGEYVQSECDSTRMEIALRFNVASDGAWSDQDGNIDTDGAAQIDNIAVRFNGTLVSFATFEDGSLSGWTNNSLNVPPSCDAGSGVCVATFGQPVVLDGSGSVDIDGEIISWEWNLGNGDTRFGEIVNYVYPTPGTYVVTLTVTDDRCATANCEVEVRICPPAKMSGSGRIATGPLYGAPRPEVAKQPASQYFERELYMRRFRFRKIREFLGKGEWFAEAIVQPLGQDSYRQTTVYPPTAGKFARDLKRSKRQKRCDHPTDESCDLDPENPSTCRWEPIGGGINAIGNDPWLMYQDYSVDAYFCDCLEVHVDWHELDKNGADILKAIASNLDFIEPCIKALFPATPSTGKPNTASTKLIPIANCVVQAGSSIASMWSEINDIPYDRPRQMGRFYTELGGLNTPICIPPVPGCTGGLDNASARFDYAGTSTMGKIFDPKSRPKQNASSEFGIRLICSGESQTVGTPDCLNLDDCTNPCEISHFEFGQISGGELHFRTDITCPTLRDPSAFIGTREFIWAIDADNDPDTGDPAPPLCGADYYVSIRVVSDGTNISVTRSIFCWDADECCPTTAGWILQATLPYNVDLAEQSVAATVAMSAVGNPLANMSAWTLCRDENGNLRSSLPQDPCSERLQIMKTADTECPKVRAVTTGLLTDGDRTAAITVQFSEPIQLPLAIDVSFSPPANVTISLDPTRRFLTLTPVTEFEPTYYECTLSGNIQDLDGNLLRGSLDPFDAPCGSPFRFDFCVGNSGFVLQDAASVPTSEFELGESIFVAGNSIGSFSGIFAAYVIAADAIGEIGAHLVDLTDSGPTPIGIAGGSFAMQDLGSVARPGEYALVIDVNNDGMLQLSDAVIQHCTPSLFVGEPCDDSVDGLFSLWPFDEVVGSPFVQDLTGTRVGQPSGGATLNSGAGQVSGYLQTTSASGGGVVVVASDADLDLADEDFSVTGWVRPGPGADPVILDKLVGNQGYRLALSGGQLALTLADGTSSQTFNSAATVNIAQWNHVAVAVDRADPAGVRMWINGSADPTHDPTAQSGSLSNGADLWIGKGRSQPSPYQLDLDELALWEEVIELPDVQALFAAGLLGKACPDSLEATAVRPDDSATRRKLTLQNPYPNPFNPRTKVVVDLSVAQRIGLVIFDARGREVRVLKDGLLQAGRHEVEWDGRDSRGNPATSGVYYIRLRGLDAEESVKVVMLK